jgi:hypothetical protein
MVAVIEVVAETRTARRKRMKAARGVKEKRSGAAELQSLKARFLQRCCSEYWFYQRAAGATTPIGTTCQCVACAEARHFAWPRPHVGSVGISFDCFCEHADLEPSDERLARDSTMRAGEAIAAGLTVKRERQLKPNRVPDSPTRVLRKPCQGGCEGGLCEIGEKYCLACKARVMREMNESGYLQRTV